MAKALLVPSRTESNMVQTQILQKRIQAKNCYDEKAHNEMPHLNVGDYVHARPPPQKRGSPWQSGMVVQELGPRSYVVESGTGQQIRRNRCHLSLSDRPKVVSHPIFNDVPIPMNNDIVTGPVEFNAYRPQESVTEPVVQVRDAAVEIKPYCTKYGREVKPRKFYDPSSE